MKPAHRISIIVPVLNESADITRALQALQNFRRQGAEVLVVDGGSHDATVALARQLADQVLEAPRGRGSQMNAGARQASGGILVFLHADTRLPESALTDLAQTISDGARWGRFDVRISGRSLWLRVVAAMMNWRSRLTGIATGDQAIFVTREAFAAAAGFPDIPLMEDIEFSARLRTAGKPACLRSKVLTSGRRWERHGVWTTILRMWWLRLRFYFGVNPDQLAREYGYAPRDS